jgi:hypothetical protein
MTDTTPRELENLSAGRVHIADVGFIEPGARAKLDPDHPSVAELVAGGTLGEPGQSIYHDQTRAELEQLVKDRGLDDEVEGTGANGQAIKDDLVAALEAADAQ